jgi:phosphoglycolate phosphatase-like HAD superfamily hydrolase
MLDRLVQDSGISREQLELEFHQIHKKYGTSEYAFSIEELPSLKAKHPGEDLVKKYAPAIKAYRDAREQALRLYPSVQETLEVLKDKGCLIVGYTESMVFYTSYRMRKLGLDRQLDFLFSPPDHAVPDNLKRFYPPDYYELRRTLNDHTPKGELKPNPKILLQILQKIGADKSEVIYIGDSLMKDVVMAQQARVTDVWAKYGAADKREEYELLRRVTHWTDEVVALEKTIQPQDVKPSLVLRKSFSEILELFDFSRFVETRPSSAVVEVWKKVVDVQQHFNDLELRIRNYALTVLGGLFAVIGFAIKEHAYRGGLVGVLVASLVLLYAFYFMDRHWYHPLLLGSVKHGSFIEDRYRRNFPEMGLTTAIGNTSGEVKVWWWPSVLHSDKRVFLFYAIVAASLFAMLISMLVLVNFEPAQSTSVPTAQASVSTPSTTGSRSTQLPSDAARSSEQPSSFLARPSSVATP